MTGHLRVRAAHAGFVTAEARRVAVQRGHFTAVGLPLEVAEVDWRITTTHFLLRSGIGARGVR